MEAEKIMDFTHLHLHSHYSVLDGLGKVPDVVKRAVELGFPAVAITDHASMSCLPELMKEAEAAGIKPIPGCEFYVVDNAEGEKTETRIHLTVLAKSWAGVQSILQQLTVANSQFYRRPRLTWEQALQFKECVVMTACSIGPLSQDDYERRVHDLLRAYRNDLYLEIMPHVFEEEGVDFQRVVNERAIEMFTRYNIQLVATNDAHYIRQEDAHTHEILLAVQTGASWKDPKRWSFGSHNFFMRSQEEMAEAFSKCGYVIDPAIIRKAFAGVDEVIRKCDVVMPDFEVHLPSIYADDEATFAEKILEGWNSLVVGAGLPKAEYLKRLVYEVGVIKRLGFIRYFLIVEDVIFWARKNGIMVGPGRGSAAGSLICYLLGITQVDPIKYGLYFERFLNPERVDLPDIDVDFSDDRREEVFAYLREKYGPDKTARITTFNQLSPKSAFRDVARVFDVNMLTTNMLSKQIEDEESFEEVADLVKFAKENPSIIEQAKALSGTIRAQGVHACGFVISSDPLSGIAAIERRSDAMVVNWDKNDAERFGLLKVDILGLSTLSILSAARKMILERHGIDIDFTKIPLDDEKTLASFRVGDGVGVFQFENGGMQQLLRDLDCNSFDTATDTTALFRPGSLNSGQTGAYVRIAKGDEYEHYETPLLKSILGPTRGVLVYQEQIMQIFVQLGGFSWAGADKMRKIIGKKLGKEEFEKHRAAFVEGCEKNGVDSSAASALFDKMAEFAAYSFNKSHAVAYTMLSFWSMYLKVHYTSEFFCAQLGNSSDERIAQLVREAERHKLRVRLPDINLSEDTYALDEDGAILPPLGVIKGVGEKAVAEILLRRSDGPFLSEADFVDRVTKRTVNSRVRGFLARAGALESLGVVNADAEDRTRGFAELLPTFNTIPRLTLGSGDIDVPALTKLLTSSALCARDAGRPFLMPKFAPGAHRPSIMVINNNVKNEREHLTSDGTAYLLKILKEGGIKQKDLYYTSPVKCFYDKGKQPSRECEGKCHASLRDEVRAVAPKLIICFASSIAPIFTSEKGGMGKLHGKLIFNKQYGCYVLFSYSPQLTYFQEGYTDRFGEAMKIVGEIFT